MKLRTWSLQKTEAVFNPSSKEHRQAYYDFLKSRSWKNSKYNFVLEDDHIDLPSSIRTKLMDYYISREFGPYQK